MPFRLDAALWGISLAITLGRRSHLLGTTDGKYISMKYATWGIDYLYFGASLYIFDTYMAPNFSPELIFYHQVMNSFLVVMIDVLKYFLFLPLLPKAKTEHIAHMGSSIYKMLFSIQGCKENVKFIGKLLSGQGTLFEWDEGKAVRRNSRHQLWYFVKIGIVSIPLVCAAQAEFMGTFSGEPLNEAIYIIGSGEWYECSISRFLMVYLEFLIMAFIKDALCMNILHQLFHTKYYDHHKTHHLPMKELSVMNAFYFDIFDLFAEDGIAPLLLIGIKMLGGGNASVHYMSYFFIVLCDQTVHSLDVYTSVFWNPLLDNVLRGALSHNLHHATNRGHYTIWPLHHFVGVETAQHKSGKALDGFEVDINDFNKLFDTNYPLLL